MSDHAGTLTVGGDYLPHNGRTWESDVLRTASYDEVNHHTELPPGTYIIRTAEQDAARSAVIEAAELMADARNEDDVDLATVRIIEALAALNDTETTGHATDRPEGET